MYERNDERQSKPGYTYCMCVCVYGTEYRGARDENKRTRGYRSDMIEPYFVIRLDSPM